MNPDLSVVFESHEIWIKSSLCWRNVLESFDTDVHIEPAPIPEDEILDNVYKNCLCAILISTKETTGRTLIDDFVYIRQDGEQMDKEAYAEKTWIVIKDIQITSIRRLNSSPMS